MSQPATDPVVNPKHTKKRKKLDDGMDGSDPLLSGNRFALLANNNIADGHKATSVRLQLAEEVKIAAGHEATPATVSKAPVNQAAAPRLKLPPIVVVNYSFGDLRKKIYEANIKPIFKITRFGIKVTCSTEAEHAKVISLLAETEAEFYTHDRVDSRPVKVVLSGLPNVFPDSLKDQLKLEIGVEPLAVYRMTRRAEGNSKVRDTQYLIHFPKGSTTLKQLQQIKTVDSIVVQWDRYRQRKNDVTHCQNCLHFGHGSRNCHMYSRCNRCGATHPTDECEQDATSMPRCANCQGQHPATDRSCPKRAEFLQIRKQASSINQPGRKPPKLPEYTPESFPPLGRKQGANAKSENHQRQATPPAGFRTFASVVTDPPPQDAPSTQLFSTAELMSIFMEITAACYTCRTKAEQLNALANIVIKYGP